MAVFSDLKIYATDCGIFLADNVYFRYEPCWLMKEKLIREITPLTQSDCFTILCRTKSEFDFPLHYHEEFELNFIQNAKDAKRVIRDHIEEIGEMEMVLVGPNLRHGWFNHKCKSKEITEITIQFHRDRFDDKFLHRKQISFIRNMFEE